MLCPEGMQSQNDIQNDNVYKEEVEDNNKKNKKVPTEGPSSLELNLYKSPKNWKKSISKFFRNQLRSTKSNEGDRPPGSQEKFEEKEVSPEQKWQSLGKVFRRQSFAESWNKSPTQGESSQNKRLAVRKVLSSYFGKSQKSHTVADDN